MARYATVLFALFVIIAASACDDTDQGRPTDRNHGSSETAGRARQAPVVDCSAAILNRVDPRWRHRSVVRGNIGLYGNAADIDTAARWGVGAYWTKIPVILAGHAEATLRVASRDRDRVGLTYGPSASSPATLNDGARGLTSAPRTVRFVPCANRPTTAWPGGLVLADRNPVSFRVRVDGRRWRSLTLPPLRR